MAQVAITIQDCRSANGQLNVTYAVNGDAGGNGIAWPLDRLSDFELQEEELTTFCLRAILTYANRRGLTPAQVRGKTFTLNLGALANLITVR